MKNKFYITTTLPYINADPHVGFAREIIEADVLARFHRILNEEVFFNTGTDEHGLKIFRKAEGLGMDTQKYCNEKALEFDRLKGALNLSYNNFIRTTDEAHIKAAQEFWKLCDKNGYIYKKNYKIKYCVGCELEKTDSELVDGKCPDHPNMELETIEEENYFFKFSAFQDKLLELYKNNPDFVRPAKRFNEVKRFVELGLEDFSISRIKEKMPWGVPVPGDENQVIYVWFDALVNYISALGWPKTPENFEKFWPGYQICGKDNLRQQSAMWQAMLMSVNLPTSVQIFVNGFITVNGQKMSKSLGNVISPYEMVEKFGIDATRYLLLSGASFGEDFDITWDKLIEKYNADLANGLGNLLSRVITLAQKGNFQFSILNFQSISNDKFSNLINNMELGQALEYIWKIIDEDNKFIGDNKPWELVKTDMKKFEEVMKKLLEDLNLISGLLVSFMPETSQKIKKALETKKIEEVLFQRIK
ncbi:MAG: Methionine-tRNA ligase [Candidatus Moranbacteria bacterium GW2011_GWF2_36_839]|nr:MAG: Methionine-tRNA ligase [Candidatus Moranbacteria bacterium GW2011_GWF1_36_78]KKQ16566.1 MAG: Methionine-tRNA ligase [Candidatus Moranbacteria bacterium GW2011_GWF2_36_839]HAT73976.1 methionine--tRNA ligase [Candidatus Moranbacteria bacterium]HBY10886.1 methionine--tRNA ligase [Candidatus Moranbacteria bacterium]